MKIQKHTIAQSLWLKARSFAVCQALDDRIEFIASRTEKTNRLTKKKYYMFYLKWRKGYNLYVGGNYDSAIEVLKEVLKKMDRFDIDDFSHFDQVEGCGVEV